MAQRKLLILVTEADDGVLADDSPQVTWELFPYDFAAVERSLDFLLCNASKEVTPVDPAIEDRESQGLGPNNLEYRNA